MKASRRLGLLAPLLLAGTMPDALPAAAPVPRALTYRRYMSRRQLRDFASTLPADVREAIRASPPHRMEGEGADAFAARMDVRRAL